MLFERSSEAITSFALLKSLPSFFLPSLTKALEVSAHRQCLGLAVPHIPCKMKTWGNGILSYPFLLLKTDRQTDRHTHTHTHTLLRALIFKRVSLCDLAGMGWTGWQGDRGYQNSLHLCPVSSGQLNWYALQKTRELSSAHNGGCTIWFPMSCFQQ